jgi:predicted nucleic acid-binding protein
VSVPLVFLDVNIPMYAAGRAHAYKDPCVRVMKAIAEGRLEAAIDVEIVQEILHRYGAIGRRDVAIAMSSNLLDLASVVYPITSKEIRATISLFDRYAKQGILARDLIHVAVMLSNGLEQIVSVDSHFDEIEGVTRLDPLTYVLP